MSHHRRPALRDIAIGLVAGALATRLTGHVQDALERMMPPDVLAREARVRPGVPTRVAVRKAARAFDAAPSEGAVRRLGCGVHYATGAAYGPLYAVLRGPAGLSRPAAAAGLGVAMSASLDEGLGPLLGLSAPPRAYPWQAHARGLVAHLAFGAFTALAHEALERAAGRRAPQPAARGPVLRAGPF